ncbi:hypothetical protein EDC04DRAFT_2601249 [Pisolithus marmoratus]|nr:hypothetical protein EDC04DRAFT_2601249 [Pisolithus marmoratus]
MYKCEGKISSKEDVCKSTAFIPSNSPCRVKAGTGEVVAWLWHVGQVCCEEGSLSICFVKKLSKHEQHSSKLPAQCCVVIHLNLACSGGPELCKGRMRDDNEAFIVFHSVNTGDGSCFSYAASVKTSYIWNIGLSGWGSCISELMHDDWNAIWIGSVTKIQPHVVVAPPKVTGKLVKDS